VTGEWRVLVSSVRARTPARRGNELPAPPTTGIPNVWFSGLLSAPPSLTLSSPIRIGWEVEGVRPRTGSTLERDAPAMLSMRLCARARCTSTSDTLYNETCELCRELAPLPVPVPVPVPVPEPELICHDRERRWNVPLIRAGEAALPFRERDEPRNDTRGLDWDEAGERRPTESSRSRASSEPSGDGWSERDVRSSSSRSEPEPMLSAPRSCCCCCNASRMAVSATAGVGDICIVPAR
jgi:hypothetical protein